MSAKKTTTSFFCRYCNHAIRLNHHLLFDAAVTPMGKLRMASHVAIHHWHLLPAKARCTAPLRIAICAVAFIMLEILDILHAVLWIATWPFWWLHEELF